MFPDIVVVLLSLADRFLPNARAQSLAPDGHFAAEYLPTPDSLRARSRLPNSDPNFLDPVRVAFEYAVEVKSRWDQLSVDADLIARFSDTNLAAAEADVERSSAPVQPLHGIGDSDFGDKAFRVHLDHSVNVSNFNVSMREIVEGIVDAQTHPELDVATASVDAAIALLLPLRRFDDTVIRLLAAKQAQTMTGVPMPEVLALYREEGGLGVFPSSSSIRDPAGGLGPVGTPVGNVPSASVADMVAARAAWRSNPNGVNDNANSGEMTLINIGFRPDISHLVWLGDPGPSPKAQFAGHSDTYIREFALATAFMVQPIGGDVLGSLYAPFAYSQRTNFVDAYAQQSAAKWQQAGFAVAGDPVAAASARWIAMRDTLDIWRTKGHSGSLLEAVAIAPKDPVLLMANILAEGLALMRGLKPQSTIFGPSFTDPFPFALAAMRYNAFMNPKNQLVLAAIVSALHSAVRQKHGFDALRASLRADPQMWSADPSATSFLGEATQILAKKESSADHTSDMNTLALANPGDPELVDKRLSDWMLRGNNTSLLFDFLLSAGTRQWDSFPGMRAHSSRTNRMVAFYTRVFA